MAHPPEHDPTAPPGVEHAAAAGPELGPELAPVVAPEASLRTITVVHWGMLVWAVLLVAVLLVPDARAGDRSWWVWVPVSGLGLGALGHVYLARGRGNAADA